MPTPALTDDTIRKTLGLIAQHGNLKTVAGLLGKSVFTIKRHQREGQRRQLSPSPVEATGFEVGALPDELPTADELLARRKKEFARKAMAAEARHLVPIAVRDHGPIGIAHFGDPHVDDPGTDIALLEQHVACVNATAGLYGANVGDITNNWVGRLARLYGQQSTSAAEAWVLAEWLMSSLRWLYVVGGNHDVWSGDADPVKWLARQAGTLYEWHGVRIDLQFPNGRRVRVNARHDFTGHSMWNTAHGPAKAIQMGWRDHVLTCGHTHVSGYQVLRDPATGLVSHALRVGSYKTLDRYVTEQGLPNQTVFVCPVTIVDPKFGDDDPRLITTIFDPLEAADYLTWKRARKAA